MCWMACYQYRTRVCVDTYSYTINIFDFSWGMLKTGVCIYISTRILLDRRFGSILIWGNNIDCFRALNDEI